MGATDIRDLINKRLNKESSAFAELMLAERSATETIAPAVKAGARLKYPRLIEPRKIKADRRIIPRYLSKETSEKPVELAVRNGKGFAKTPTLVAKLLQ